MQRSTTRVIQVVGLFASGILALGCSKPPANDDDTDAGVVPDTGRNDTGLPDSGSDTGLPDTGTEVMDSGDEMDAPITPDTGVDAGSEDTGPGDAGFDAFVAPVTDISIGGTCTYAGAILHDGTVICGDNPGSLFYYVNGSGASFMGDLDLDGTDDVTYAAGGSWTEFASGIGLNASSFGDDPVTGDVYYMGFDSGHSFIKVLEGGVEGTESDFAPGLPLITFETGLVTDDDYLYARTDETTIARWALSTGDEDTALVISDIPTGTRGIAVTDDVLYLQNETQIFSVDKAAGGAGTVFAGTGEAGSALAADGTSAVTADMSISAYSATSVVNGTLYFVDQTGFSTAVIRYVDGSGDLQTVAGLAGDVNRPVYVRGNIALVSNSSVHLLP